MRRLEREQIEVGVVGRDGGDLWALGIDENLQRDRVGVNDREVGRERRHRVAGDVFSRQQQSPQSVLRHAGNLVQVERGSDFPIPVGKGVITVERHRHGLAEEDIRVRTADLDFAVRVLVVIQAHDAVRLCAAPELGRRVARDPVGITWPERW